MLLLFPVGSKRLAYTMDDEPMSQNSDKKTLLMLVYPSDAAPKFRMDSSIVRSVTLAALGENTKAYNANPAHNARMPKLLILTTFSSSATAVLSIASAPASGSPSSVGSAENLLSSSSLLFERRPLALSS